MKNDASKLSPRPVKRFRVYSMCREHSDALVAEYDTEEELLGHTRRLDRVEAVAVTGRYRTVYVPFGQFIAEMKTRRKAAAS